MVLICIHQFLKSSQILSHISNNDSCIRYFGGHSVGILIWSIIGDKCSSERHTHIYIYIYIYI